MVEGGTEVKPKKELVPLLGVPDERVEGHEAHYVTMTTKARWDGKRIVKSYGVQLTLLTTVDERRCDVRNCQRPQGYRCAIMTDKLHETDTT